MSIPEPQENVSLAGHTTFRIGGPARHFVVAGSVEELLAAVEYARAKSWPFFLLGGGSNLLVSDKGFPGLVIKNKNEEMEIKNVPAGQDGEKLAVACGAGTVFGRVIMETVRLGYSGAEWGFGIPGTVGGAICGNAGRLGQAIAQIVENVTVLDGDLRTRTLSKDDCGFGYRESRFKKTGEIILSATLLFEKKEPSAVDTVLEEAKAVVRHSPPFPSAGCVFKNYNIQGQSDELLKGHPELVQRVRGGKLGVGFLIEQCGLKGRQIGGASIWEGHANYMVNTGGAKAADVVALISLVKESVKARYGIELEEEIRYVGF